MARSRPVRAGVAALVAALAMPTSAFAMLTPESAANIERLYLEGQDRYAEKDYVGAAERWTELLNALPERPEHRATRENVLINIIHAYLDAYRRNRMDDGRRNEDHLRAGQAIVDDYRRQLGEVYGEEVEMVASVQELADRLQQELWAAEDFDIQACLQPCLQPCLSPLPPLPSRRGCGDDHREMALLGALVLPGFVRRRRKDVLEQVSARLPADVVQRLLARLEDDAGSEEG